MYGQEEFLVQEAVDLIIAKAVEPGGGDFNFNTVYCRDTSAAEIVNLCQTLPFMSAKRLVIAKDIDALKAGDLEELLPYLNDPSPSTCLVLISNQERYEKKAGDRPPSRPMAPSPGSFRCSTGRWRPGSRGRRRHAACRWSGTRAQYLWQTIGNDLQKLLNELEKVEIYIKGKKTITYRGHEDGGG